MEKVSVPETYVHRIFVGGVFLKALNGVVEILAGIAFLFPARITLFFKSILPASFIQNPNIYFITHLKALILTISAHAGPFV
ncbi:MAG TPA: hypothetical protein VE868_00695, partial [Balneolaceae bacterium]|nr:hypothetical protein [Balneolaceae bacterium]